MLFLLNDVVLSMDSLEKPAEPINLRAISSDRRAADTIGPSAPKRSPFVTTEAA